MGEKLLQQKNEDAIRRAGQYLKTPAELWRQRLPDAGVRARTYAVAHRGDTFLRRPRLGSVSLLEHFVRLSPAERALPAQTAGLHAWTRPTP